MSKAECYPGETRAGPKDTVLTLCAQNPGILTQNYRLGQGEGVQG